MSQKSRAAGSAAPRSSTPTNPTNRHAVRADAGGVSSPKVRVEGAVPWAERRKTAWLTLMTETSKRIQAAARGYRTRTPSIQTKNRISCRCNQQRALLHGGSPSSLTRCEQRGWQQPDTGARGIEARRGKEDNIPGRSIPQWYSYRLFVKLMRKATGDTVSLSTTISRRPLPAASTGAYLKRKQRANLLIRSIIPSLSRKESWKER
jgi:hypothetical protein